MIIRDDGRILVLMLVWLNSQSKKIINIISSSICPFVWLLLSHLQASSSPRQVTKRNSEIPRIQERKYKENVCDGVINLFNRSCPPPLKLAYLIIADCVIDNYFLIPGARMWVSSIIFLHHQHLSGSHLVGQGRDNYLLY